MLVDGDFLNLIKDNQNFLFKKAMIIALDVLGFLMTQFYQFMKDL